MYRRPDAAEPFQPTLCITLRGHHHGVRSVAFQSASTTSTSVAPKAISGGMDGAVILWDTAATARAVRFTGHRGPVLSVSPSSRPHLFASSGQDGYVRIWSPDEYRTSATYKAYPEVRATNSVCEWRAHTGATRVVAFAKDGSDRLYTVGDDKAVKSWDLKVLSSAHSKGKRLTNRFAGSLSASPLSAYTGSGHTCRITALAVPTRLNSSRVAYCVASGGDDGVVFVWDARSRDAAHVIYGGGSGVNSLSFHPDGHVLASGNDAGDIDLFDLRRSSSSSAAAFSAVHGSGYGSSYNLLQHYHAAHMNANGAGTQSVDFASNGGWLLSSGNDSATKLWDVKEGHLYCTMQAHDGPVSSSCFSDDGAWLVTGGGADKTVLIWRSGLAAGCASRALVPAVVTAATVAAGSAASTPERASSFEKRTSALSSLPLQQVSTDHACSRLSASTVSGRSHNDPRKLERDVPSGISTKGKNVVDRSSSLSLSQRPPLPLVPQFTNASTPQKAVDPSADDLNGSVRERSFERCEQRYTHFSSAPALASAEPDSAANASEVRKNAPANGAADRSREQTNSHVRESNGAEAVAVEPEKLQVEEAQLQALDRANHQMQKERILEERVSNLEDAVAALVGYMQRHQTQQEERLNALQAASREQAERGDASLAELKRAIELLTARVVPGIPAELQSDNAEEKNEKAAS